MAHSMNNISRCLSMIVLSAVGIAGVNLAVAPLVALINADGGWRTSTAMPTTVAELYTEARRHEVRRDYRGAIALYDRLLELQPNHTTAQFNRANDQFALGNHQAAVAGYSAYIEQVPGDSMGYWGRAQALNGVKRHAAALADATRAIAIAPNTAGAWNARSQAYYHLGNLRQALVNVDRALELAPDLECALEWRLEIVRHLQRSDCNEDVDLLASAVQDKRPMLTRLRQMT
jgi:tetratricopeptide (TPR) repeat protein